MEQSTSKLLPKYVLLPYLYPSYLFGLLSVFVYQLASMLISLCVR